VVSLLIIAAFIVSRALLSTAQMEALSRYMAKGITDLQVTYRTAGDFDGLDSDVANKLGFLNLEGASVNYVTADKNWLYDDMIISVTVRAGATDVMDVFVQGPPNDCRDLITLLSSSTEYFDIDGETTFDPSEIDCAVGSNSVLGYKPIQ